ncbi:MAG: cupin [Methylophilales bacterium 28-44-11]|jgi:50S ribosomal protein L16 3-hydroxylase|nr:MAG: cupin [Methylophilales bacterium 28-44-11]
MQKHYDLPWALLNQLTPAQFLAEYWQKKPLLIRQAIPQFEGLLTPDELAGLACEEEVQSRLVQYLKGQWHVIQGPMSNNTFKRLPQKEWTLLVQSVNHYLPEAAALLAQFNFIPHARLDDLMVSYAPDGGGVGPHLDSYDVFLLQGSGKRQWRISQQTDLSLIEGAPLRILKHFETEQEWILEAGDMLYLPPQIAHWGTAVGDDCMTYSIGFRAPKTQELAHEFLHYLQDQLTLSGMYADADLTLQAHPAEISHAMVEKVHQSLQAITWQPQHVGDFLGRYLTEPKPHVVFAPPKKMSQKLFNQRIQQHTLFLELASQMLFWQDTFYLNGETLAVPSTLKTCMKMLADTRQLDCTQLEEALLANLADMLYPHYLAGYLALGD